jgi:hypothetical protein
MGEFKEDRIMKSYKQFTKEIDSLIEERDNRKVIKDLVKIKKPGLRPKFDYSFIGFYEKENEGEPVCEIELNKKESEILRRFLYNLKKRGL